MLSGSNEHKATVEKFAKQAKVNYSRTCVPIQREFAIEQDYSASSVSLRTAFVFNFLKETVGDLR